MSPVLEIHALKVLGVLNVYTPKTINMEISPGKPG
jgi:hypothetical protein